MEAVECLLVCQISDALRPHISKTIVQGHALCKIQTHATFEAFCKRIIEQCTNIFREEGLALNTPIVLVMDNTSSHIDLNHLKVNQEFIYQLTGTNV